MYLKQIELLGFKSFPRKTTVRFSPGVTAIVGPNGCGKTNILDALRWVLGEQKPTLLRGAKMEEVIFNGTREMKPLGMSEVSLSVVNDRGVLPTEYHEVRITRRLFRSGESEYLINKVPCRLKDITDLFVDTGMGAHSYSVIQQHMIDSVISDKAEERRFLFEEAAGITKYKQRRKAALRKLEATENDFLRLRDIYAEVKTRANSLYRQHKKAERYKLLSDRIEAWELYLHTQRLRTLDHEKRELQASHDSLSDQKTGRTTVLDQASAELEADRQALLEFEQELTQISSQIYAITEEAHQMERQVSVLKEKKANNSQLIVKNRAEMINLEARAGSLGNELKEAGDQKGLHESDASQLEQQLSSARDSLNKADVRLLGARTDREAENKKLFELEGRLSSGMTEESSLRDQQQDLENVLGQLEESKAGSLLRQTELIAKIEDKRSELNSLLASRAKRENQQVELKAKIEAGIEGGEELALEISTLTASMEACEARRLLLEEMMLQYEGYEAGVVEAMDQVERFSGIVGTVADKFVPVEGMEQVVEAALGEISKFLVCRDRSTAESVIAHLRSEGKGRVGILVPQTGTIAPVIRRPELKMDGIVGWLDNMVATDEELRPLLEAVVSQTVVYEAGADVDQILELLPYGFSAVSTDGMLYRKNLVAGGSDDRFPLFRRKEKIAEQAAELAELGRRLDEVQQRKNQNLANLAASRAESSSLVEVLRELGEEIDKLQAEVAEFDFAQRSLSGEFDRLKREKQNLTEKLESITGRQYSLGLDSSQMATQKANLVQRMNNSGDQAEALEKLAADAAAQVSHLQVAFIEARNRAEQSAHRIRHIEEISSEVEQSRLTAATEIEQAQQEIDTGELSLRTLEADLEKCFSRREERSKTQEEWRRSQSERQEMTAQRETRVKKFRQEKETLADTLHQTDIRLTAIASEINNLTTRMNEEYEVDLTTLEPKRPEDPIADDEAPNLVGELKEKLKKFGAVNLLALEEYDVAQEREKFLGEQLTDLTSAKNDLRSTITKINHTARELFNDTFSKVQENFSKLFVELFAGGEARISLVDPDDPLESDIEIIARPSGKKLLPITVLSGGERALTAISLLFSLYLVKPSPFCILDEIDAPLDDANCRRFLTIIRNFSHQTQFIVITHNKITMEAADNLYGITMEQAGVSKLVAVRFAAGDNGRDDATVTIDATPEVEETPAEQPAEELPETIRERINPSVTIRAEEES